MVHRSFHMTFVSVNFSIIRLTREVLKTFIQNRKTSKKYEMESSIIPWATGLYEEYNRTTLKFNGIHVDTQVRIPLLQISKKSELGIDRIGLFLTKWNVYHEVATKASFGELLQSRENDFNATCLCFQQKTRTRSVGFSKMSKRYVLKSHEMERKKYKSTITDYQCCNDSNHWIHCFAFNLDKKPTEMKSISPLTLEVHLPINSENTSSKL